ncbi:AbrB/MazE/SpoVT family DNA-binding domain-containing protein [Immundisolibacter sp.]|jgi:AbrB family looped-hinge helix DNA binding protein|uniref:AbrB/MazE/SpoVT family DNA-binding domain-containing protein n=1 Tax=Immundisolibacter sp. TaxID=1934948 RepID=UPI0026226823|nr:AbrB/MazE/SpoVT family DNA-binding domain-containing protein [Immundisolibacter sp.]MDD3651998.1 AbrB/MazE/SpoVT family DNA-binding domain-containing protein [Immundisolibacter sp.]
MATATLSPKFQISIPKALREQLNLHAGQRFVVLARGESIVLVPQRSLDELRGRLRGAGTADVRERQDRV